MSVKLSQRMCEFDKVMDMACRVLKTADRLKGKDALIESHFVCKTGGFKVVRYKDGKHFSLRCVEDLWNLVKDPKVKAEMLSKDKTGILASNGLKFVQ